VDEGIKADIAEVGWDVAVLALKQGTCDLFASSIVYTAPRAISPGRTGLARLIHQGCAERLASVA